MRTTIKFHALAISIICTIVVVLYLVMDPQTPETQSHTPQTGERQVEIVNATWGENCNEYIEQTIKSQQFAPPEKDAQGNPIPAPVLKKVSPDNVKNALVALCNGQYNCELRADSQTLGLDPMATCFKQLKVAYRCFSVDRLNSKTLDQGDILTIDCTTAPAANAPAPPAAR